MCVSLGLSLLFDSYSCLSHQVGLFLMESPSWSLSLPVCLALSHSFFLRLSLSLTLSPVSLFHRIYLSLSPSIYSSLFLSTTLLLGSAAHQQLTLEKTPCAQTAPPHQPPEAPILALPLTAGAASSTGCGERKGDRDPCVLP